MFCTDLIKMPNHSYMQYYNNLLPCNTHFILHISTSTSKCIQISLVPFLDALTVEALDEWWVCSHAQACCSLGYISALCRPGWHSLPSAACLYLWLCLKHTVSGLRLGNSLSPANLNAIPFLFACRSLIKMWAAIRLSPGQAKLPPSSLLKDGFLSTAPSEICYSGSS